MDEIQYSRYNPISIIRQLIKGIILVLFVVICFSVFYQVVLRYIFQAPPTWTEEVARFSLVWLVLLGSSVCIRKGRHFNVDYVTHLMSKRIIYILSIVLNVLIVLFLSVAFYYGIIVMIRSFNITSPALGIRMAYVQMVFPIGFGVMLMEAVLIIYELFKCGMDRNSNNYS